LTSESLHSRKTQRGQGDSRILKAVNRKDGYFEGNGYQVTWTFGHLCTLKNPDDYTPTGSLANAGVTNDSTPVRHKAYR
jgi:DNA topoisomerase IA